MKNRVLTAIVAGSVFFVSACQSGSNSNVYSLPKVSEGKVILTVNGTEIHEGLIKALGEISPRLKEQLDNPMTRKKILNSLADQELLYQEAVKRGLGSDPDVQIKSLLNQRSIVSNALLEKELDSSMKKSYDERKKSQFTKISLAQIAVNFVPEADSKAGTAATDEQKTKALEKANALKARLDKGEDFATIAKESSDDKRTAAKGGDAGQVSKDDKRYERLGLKMLVEKAFTLKNGEVAGPIVTADAYYIIKVTSDPVVTNFEEAKKVLGFELQSKVKEDLLSQIKKNAKVTFAETAPTTTPEVNTKAPTATPVPTPSAEPKTMGEPTTPTDATTTDTTVNPTAAKPEQPKK